MKTSIHKIEDNEPFLKIYMDKDIDLLRKEIWKAIHKFPKKFSECDIAMALSLVNYEIIHHSK